MLWLAAGQEDDASYYYYYDDMCKDVKKQSECMARKKEWNCDWDNVKQACVETAPVWKTTAKAQGGSKPALPVKGGGSVKPPEGHDAVKAAKEECKKNAACKALLDCKAQHHTEQGTKGSDSGAKPQVPGSTAAAAKAAIAECGKNPLCKALMACQLTNRKGQEQIWGIGYACCAESCSNCFRREVSC